MNADVKVTRLRTTSPRALTSYVLTNTFRAPGRSTLLVATNQGSGLPRSTSWFKTKTRLANHRARLFTSSGKVGEVSLSLIDLVGSAVDMSDHEHVQEIISGIKSDLDDIFFSQANITDVLLPFPADGRGLPSNFRKSPERIQRFCERQSEYLDKEDAIDAAIQGDSLRHLHLDAGIIDQHFLDNQGQAANSLGETRYSTVYAVRTKKHGQPQELALKKLARPHLNPQGWSQIDHVGDGPRNRYPDPRQEAFERELSTLTKLRTKPRERGNWHLSRIRDDHIISIRSSFTDPSYFGLFLSPRGLCDLETLLRKYEGLTGSPEITLYGRRMVQAEMRSWLFGCFGCLAATVLFLHRSNLRHRDLKPKNVIIYESGLAHCPQGEMVNEWKVCVIDFATAKEFTTGGNADTQGEPQIFTPSYVSPEKATKQPRTEKEDMYHLGRIFLEILIPLTGRKLDELEAKLLAEHEEPRDQYLQVFEKFLKWSEFVDWLRNSGTSTTGISAALSWTIKLVCLNNVSSTI